MIVAEFETDPLDTVKVAMPTATAVTTPCETVITLGFEVDQEKLTPPMVLPFWSLATAVNDWVAPTSRLAEFGVNEILVSTGAGAVPPVTVTTDESRYDPEIARITAVPADTPRTDPEVTVATAVLEDDHAIGVDGMLLPFESLPAAVSCVVPPTATEAVCGDTATAASC